eukprot:scaffold475332_cov23-Prasinocladus_malaysianus.AAC.1
MQTPLQREGKVRDASAEILAKAVSQLYRHLKLPGRPLSTHIVGCKLVFCSLKWIHDVSMKQYAHTTICTVNGLKVHIKQGRVLQP